MDFYERILNERGIEGLLAKAEEEKKKEGDENENKGELEKLKEDTKQKSTDGIIEVCPINDPENYIYLPGRTYGNYSYLDSLVAMHRLSYDDSHVQEAAKRLNLELKNTSEERNRRGYIGKITWDEALKLNLVMGNYTMGQRHGIDFLLLLKEGIEEKIPIFNGLKKQIPLTTLNEIYDEIISVRDPIRGEWLDADFGFMNNKFWVYSEHILKGKILESRRKEILLPCLMNERKKIKLISCNEQGMPTKKGKDIAYSCPVKHRQSVARLVAYSDRAGLGCGRDPSESYDFLGVRAVRAIENGDEFTKIKKEIYGFGSQSKEKDFLIGEKYPDLLNKMTILT